MIQHNIALEKRKILSLFLFCLGTSALHIDLASVRSVVWVPSSPINYEIPNNQSSTHQSVQLFLNGFCSAESRAVTVELYDEEIKRGSQKLWKSLDLAVHMSNMLETFLMVMLYPLCDLHIDPEALATVVRGLRTEGIPATPISLTSAPSRR